MYLCTGEILERIKVLIMARPIRNTPILMGKDAERFLYEISHLPSEEKRRAERARIESEAQQFVAMVRNLKHKKEIHG